MKNAAHNPRLKERSFGTPQKPKGQQFSVSLERLLQNPETRRAMERREGLVAAIKRQCRRLNDLSDSIVWTERKLNEFINEFFETDDGLDSLAGNSFEVLLDELLQREAILANSEKTA